MNLCRIRVRHSTLALLFLTTGCAGSHGPAITSDTTGFRQLSEATDICRDCVVLEAVVEFGDTVGPGFVNEAAFATQDSLGRYWINQRDGIKVFSAQGRFVGTVGRLGQGPFEFSYPLPVHTDVEGNIHIIDPGNARRTIVTPQLARHSDHRLPAGSVNDAAVLPDGNRLLLNMWLSTPTQIGLPLHIAIADSVIASFGVPVTGVLQTDFTIRRRIAIGQRRLYSAKEYEYELEIWTFEGNRLGGVLGPSINVTSVKPTFFNRSDNPIPSQIMGVQETGVDTVAVLVREPKSHWRELHEDFVYPQGQVGLRLRKAVPFDSAYSTRIDVIDLRSSSVVARTYRPELFGSFVGEGLLLQNRTVADAPRIAIWRMAIVLPRKR